MSDSIQLTCNITGSTVSVKTNTKTYKEKLKQFGNENNLRKYFVLTKIAKEISNGKQLSSIAESFGCALDKNKEDYYKELVKYYKKGGLVQLDTKITFSQTDEDVKDFINRLKEVQIDFI